MKRKFKSIKKLLVMLLVFLLTIGNLPGLGLNAKSKDTDSTKKIIKKLKKLKSGDAFTFGSYEQDNNSDNGKEAVEWVVIYKSKSSIMAVSKYALDYKQYNQEYTEVTWATCSLRKWLNGDFYNEAFGKTERSLVKTTKLKNGDGGKTTKDKVFILSVDDLNNNKYHFDGAYSNICTPTEYAVKHGLKSFDPGEDYVYEDKDRCSWWLRNLGGASMFANYMNSGGTVLNYGYVNYNATFMHDGYFQDYNIIAVRPVICISLK